MIVDNYLRLSPDELSNRKLNKLLNRLTFKPRRDIEVKVWRQKRDGTLWLPRGAWCAPELDDVTYTDNRSFPSLPKISHSIKLDATVVRQGKEITYEGQKAAYQKIINEEQGLIVFAPGSGKTQVMLAAAAAIGTRTMIVVHTNDLLEQWLRYMEENDFDCDIGIIRQKKFEADAQIVVAMVQTLVSRMDRLDNKFWNMYGATLFDECHHLPSETFELIANKTTSRYRIGATASKTRADNMHPLMQMLLGPIIYEKRFESKIPVTVRKIKTDFRGQFSIGRNSPDWFRRKQWQNLVKKLVNDPARNKLIAEQLAKEVRRGHSTLALSRRVDHLFNIGACLDELGIDYEILARKVTPPYKSKEILEDFRSGETKLVLATQIADEALDVPILSCVALVFPARHKDKILQQVGRALREAPNKDSATILDFADWNVKLLRNHWHDRRSAYKSWDFKIVTKKAEEIPFLSDKKRKVVFNYGD